jgi:hypothetical protein
VPRQPFGFVRGIARGEHDNFVSHHTRISLTRYALSVLSSTTRPSNK